ncbi:DB module domain-containing protein [Ditylenchus destructor]|nr:DB module domain-containing protein [Ditylenchus destructor]
MVNCRQNGQSATGYIPQYLAIFLSLIIFVPPTLCQYYYHNGYWYPAYQYYQVGDQQQTFVQPQRPQSEIPSQQQPQTVIFNQQPPPPPPAINEERNQEVLPQMTTTILPPKRVPAVDTRLEFDLPPPPPSRFLPEDEEQKIKIAQLIAQQKQHRPRGRPATAKPLPPPKPERRRPSEITLATTTLQPSTEQIRQQPELISESQTPVVSHLSPKRNNPNSVFLACCLNKNVDKKCESRCNFDVLSKKVLTQMFLGTDPCPQNHGLDLFSCAAQDGDHTECCLSKKVEKTAAGNKCLAFCKMTPGSNFQADASYLPCWAVLNHVKTCFKQAIINNDASK